jgi:dolichyl-phosphate-mannose--protein O-mannosyl transferase
LFGVLMIPLLYLFARDMFRSTFWASVAALLFAFDFMRFAQTRLATIDTYIVFFTIAMFYCMYKYYKMTFYETDFYKTLVPLAFSGLFMGLGVAAKWQGVYAGIGLAVVFGIIMVKRYMEFEKSKKKFAAIKGSYGDFYKLARNTCLWCVLFFVAVPLVVYILSFLPQYINGNLMFTNVRENVGAFDFPRFFWTILPDNRFGNFLLDVLAAQGYMYWYHGVHVLTATHTFSSEWWQWVLNLRNVWYYAGQVGEYRQGINAFGNPVVWWGGFAAILFCAYRFVRKYDRTTLFLMVGYLAMLLPWVFVPRLAWIYHYFPNVPFIILLTVHAIRMVWGEYGDSLTAERNAKITAGVVVAASVAMFALFYPILAGVAINPEIVRNYLEWFNSWHFI